MIKHNNYVTWEHYVEYLINKPNTNINKSCAYHLAMIMTPNILITFSLF